MQRGCERPGHGSVDGRLDEPQRVLVVADPTLFETGVDVDSRYRLLVPVTVNRAGTRGALGRGGQVFRDAGALAEVVVVCPGSVALDLGTGGLGGAAVELHSATHANHLDQASVDYRRQPHMSRSQAVLGLGPFGPS